MKPVRGGSAGRCGGVYRGGGISCLAAITSWRGACSGGSDATDGIVEVAPPCQVRDAGVSRRYDADPTNDGACSGGSCCESAGGGYQWAAAERR